LVTFAAQYTQNVELYRLGQAEPFLTGKAAMADHYAQNRFNLPHLHAKVVNCMVFGNKVIDHEVVSGVPDENAAPMIVTAIYEATSEGICKVWFVS
jgi:hypothetical protein